MFVCCMFFWRAMFFVAFVIFVLVALFSYLFFNVFVLALVCVCLVLWPGR